MKATTKPAILVVEDDPVQNRLISLMAEEVGCTYLTALTGQDGVRIAIEKKPALILMDIHLPDISGFQALKEIREESGNTSRVLLMSVDDSEEAVILGISSGADGFIAKPFKINELAMKIKRLLNLPFPKDKIENLSKNISKSEGSFSQHFSKDTMSLIFNSDRRATKMSIYTFSSILIVHLDGLTDLIDKVDSDKMHEVVNDIIGEISLRIYRNRGSIHHFIGETVFATFGTPVVYDNDTMNALLCAEDVRKLGFAKTPLLKNIKIQTAIISGKVYSGILNTEVQKISHAVMGQPIRKARCLDTQLRELNGHIIIDRQTFDVIGEYTDAKKIEAEKIGELYEVHKLLHDKIAQIPNLKKQYTPKDSVSDDGYEKL